MKYLAVLGRLYKLSLAELESQFAEVKLLTKRGGDSRKTEASGTFLATFECTNVPDINRLGGTMKIGEELPSGFNSLVEFLANLPEGKITLGISDFRKGASSRKAQVEALKLKKILQRRGRSIRVLQNKSAVLSTATSHHNQLAEKKNHVEIMLTEYGNFKLTGVQNISEYAKRDQARPARDAKVGMLPPKLAQILINLCGDLPKNAVVLDPFCGTGVVLQEAKLMGYSSFGSDLNPRMVEYTKKNLDWLIGKNAELSSKYDVLEGDATNFDWSCFPEIDAVACEAFLGQPMSLPPADIKLKQEKQNCQAIILGFLKNLSTQIKSGTPVVMAIPAWLRPTGDYSRMNILDEAENLGYNVKKFINLGQKDLLYFREGQVVAREIIVLRKK